ncbi:MAG: tRNA pseudouridine(55) synthase TruB [Betaproteobacteria bacterium]
MTGTRRAVTGVLLVDKHEGVSSGTVVGWSKRLLNAEKAGHTGTLDPFATGLLPICFGEAAKFSRFMLEANKGYRATLKLGQKSSTGDTEGEIVETRPVKVDAVRVGEVLASLLGAQEQIPPMHSALKRDGIPLYKLARQGLEIERAPRGVHIHNLTVVTLNVDELVVDTVVSKGTYIRVLGEDIGEMLGCGAHLTALRRTSTGGFDVGQSITLEALEALAMNDREMQLLAPDSLALALPRIALSPLDAKSLQNGQNPVVPFSGGVSAEYRVYDEAGVFIGIANLTVREDSTASLIASRLMTPE